MNHWSFTEPPPLTLLWDTQQKERKRETDFANICLKSVKWWCPVFSDCLFSLQGFVRQGWVVFIYIYLHGRAMPCLYLQVVTAPHDTPTWLIRTPFLPHRFYRTVACWRPNESVHGKQKGWLQKALVVICGDSVTTADHPWADSEVSRRQQVSRCSYGVQFAVQNE